MPHYKNVSDDENRTSKYAYPDNGEKGYFTPKHPTITFNDFTGGYFIYDGKKIKEPLTGDYGDSYPIAVICQVEGYEVEDVYNNSGYHYDLTDNSFNVVFTANFNITAVIGKKVEAYAYISSSSDNTPNDTLTFTYDEKRSEKDTAFDVVYSGGVPWAQYMTSEAASIQNVVVNESFSSVELNTIDS